MNRPKNQLGVNTFGSLVGWEAKRPVIERDWQHGLTLAADGRVTARNKLPHSQEQQTHHDRPHCDTFDLWRAFDWLASGHSPDTESCNDTTLTQP